MLQNPPSNNRLKWPKRLKLTPRIKIIGKPNEFAEKYYNDGADELIYVDCVATLYGRNHLSDIIKNAAQNIFVPLTVGGGIRSIEDVKDILSEISSNKLNGYLIGRVKDKNQKESVIFK